MLLDLIIEGIRIDREPWTTPQRVDCHSKWILKSNINGLCLEWTIRSNILRNIKVIKRNMSKTNSIFSSFKPESWLIVQKNKFYNLSSYLTWDYKSLDIQIGIKRIFKCYSGSKTTFILILRKVHWASFVNYWRLEMVSEI